MKRTIFVLFIMLFTLAQNILAQSPEKYLIHNLDSNQKYPDLGVTFFDDDFIIFSTQFKKPQLKHSRRVRKKVNKNIELAPQNLEYHFSAINENGHFLNPQRLSSAINFEHDDVGITFSSNSEVVYFSRETMIENSNKKHFELYRADVVSPGNWNGIVKVPFNDPKYSIEHPCLSEDNKTLYYVSNKEGNKNIYKVSIEDDNSFGNPIKLSNNINSSKDEITPFIINGKLYFSSNKDGGLGGFDIYSIELNNPNSIAKILETPINSSYDDTFFVKKDSDSGFFSSNRPGGKGQEDIYSFKSIKKDVELTVNEDNNKTITEIANNDNKSISYVVSYGNKEKSVKEPTKNIVIKETVIKDESAFDYQRRDSFNTKTESTEESTEYIPDDEYTKCQTMFDKLENVYFDYSEHYIREDAATVLNDVIRVMRLCPKIKVIASSHTDSRASYDYNIQLSQKRSASVVNYILSNGGFPQNRILGVGFGEARLVNECADGVKCSERKHQFNRRTHFEIYNY